MKLFDVVKQVGSGIVRNVVPGGDMIVDTVNEFLPDDKKLPAGATGDQIDSALAQIPADQRASVMEKQVDVDITRLEQQGETARAMLEAEANSKHTTRPQIALMAARAVCFAIIAVVTAWSIAVLTDDPDMLAAVSDSWELILVILGAPITWLNRYFGVLRDEHRNRLEAAQGRPTQAGGIVQALGGLFKR